MLQLANERMIYRVAAGEESLMVALSLADEEVRAEVPGPGRSSSARGRWPEPGDRTQQLILPAHGWAILS